MPRRVYTYSEATGWSTLNLLATAGGAMIAASVLLFIVNVLRSRRSGLPASSNPWNAPTLEWATSSPAPAYNFLAIPIVTSREPLWHGGPGPGYVGGLAVGEREVLVTTLVEAAPDHRLAFPAPTVWPFLSAVAVAGMFIGSIFTPWAVVYGAIAIAIAVTVWFWPGRGETERHLSLEKRP
jgi:hypothetical protein